MIKILGKKYKVVKVPMHSLTDRYCGMTESSKQLITIGAGLENDHLMETLLHECVHAIDFAMATKLSERQVEAFANGLYAFFIDNNISLEKLTELIDD